MIVNLSRLKQMRYVYNGWRRDTTRVSACGARTNQGVAGADPTACLKCQQPTVMIIVLDLTFSISLTNFYYLFKIINKSSAIL